MNWTFTNSGILLSNNVLIDWEIIDKERRKVQLKNKLLLKFDFNYGRDDLYEYLIIDKESWDKIKEDIEKYDIDTVFLGEICGKHSNVTYSISSDGYTEEYDIDKIEKFNIDHGYESRNCDSYIISSLMEAIDDAEEN